MIARFLLAAILVLSVAVNLWPQDAQLAAKSKRAKEAMDAGRFEEATKLYQDLVKALPGDPRLRLNLGLSLHSGGKYQEAIRQFRAAVKQQPALGSAWLMLGVAHLKLGEAQQAVQPLQRALKADPNNGLARLELADALLSTGRPGDAAGHFKELTQVDPKNPKGWQGLGLSYVALSRQAFEELEKVAPDSAFCYVLLARSLSARNQHHAAFSYYRQAFERAPEFRAALAGLVEVYRKTGHQDWAAAMEKRIRELPPLDCATEKSECEFEAGRFDGVLELAKGEKTPEAYYWRSRGYGELALQALSQLSRMPHTAAIHELMAEAHHIQGRHEHATQEWEEALRLEPGNHRLQKGLARSLWLQRDYRQARPLLENLIKVESESSELSFELGDTLLHGETPGEAIPFLEKAVRISPDHLPARAALGQAYMRTGQLEKAIRQLEAARDIEPDGSLHYQLAQAYQKAGRSEMAQQSMQRFEEISKSLRARRLKLPEEFEITPPEGLGRLEAP